MSGPEINMDLKTLTANYCHSTAGGGHLYNECAVAILLVFADPGWLQPGCDHAILIVGLVSHFKALLEPVPGISCATL